MSRLQPVLDGALAVLRRDAVVYFSYRSRFVGQAVITFFSLVLFYYVSRLVRVGRDLNPDDYFAFVVVGLVILQVMTATLGTLPMLVRGELVAGTFERMAVSPLGPVAGIASMTLFPTLLASAVGALALAMGAAVFGLDLAWSTLPLAVPVALLASLAFVPFALGVAALVLVSKQAGGLGSLVVIVLSLAAGVYFPTSLMPGWIAWVSEVQPFTPALELMRHLLVDAPMGDPVALAVAKLVGFTVVAAPLSRMALAAAVRACRRRGTLIEY